MPAPPGLSVEPAARPVRRPDGGWRLWLGWAAAAAVHLGLLAAVICSWPSQPLRVTTAPAQVSLLLQAAVKPAPPVAVPPRPAGVAARTPAKPVAIANRGAPARMRAQSPLPAIASHMTASSPDAATDGPARANGVKMVPPDAGFAAASPLGGDVNQPPEYPYLAQLHGEQGNVLLSVHVRADGTPDSVSVTQSSGYEILDQAAARAVWKWRFRPSMLSGRPVASVIPYRINFDLTQKP